MNEIAFTPWELILGFVAFCGALITVSTAISVIWRAVEKARAPEKAQDERLDKIDNRLDEIDKTIATFREYFTNDDNRFKAIEKSNKITQGALLALLKHSLNGNDKESLKQAERSLEDYLLDK